MRSRHVVGPLPLVLLGLLVPHDAVAAQGKPGPQPQAGACGLPGNPPCKPSISIQSTTFTPVSRVPESGPFTYTISVTNSGAADGTATVTCIAPGPQLTCVTPSPETFFLRQGLSRTVTVGYQTLGAGTFRQSHLFEISGTGDIVDDSETSLTGPITVIGAMGTVTSPAEGAEVTQGDRLAAQFDHPSGVTPSTFRLIVDGVARTGTTTSNSIYLDGLVLLNGPHRVAAYGCAVNGRCDTLRTVSFTVLGPATTFDLDDFLPLPGPGGGFSGSLPGALPLPPAELRGCPVDVDDPEIRLTSPNSYFNQLGTPTGIIFLASINYDTAHMVNTLNHDYRAADNVSCANPNYVYLTDAQYDWNFWNEPVTPQSDSLWAVYPYGDRNGGAMQPAALVVTTNGGPVAPAGGSRRGGPQGGGVAPMAAAAGAINPSTFRLWLNGALIVDNDTPVPAYAAYTRKVYSDVLTQQYSISGLHPKMHRYDPLVPASDSGGWNTLEASIADSTGHRTSVRSRFVQFKPRPVRALGLTPLRDFTKVDQAECAAFGAFQCGAVMLTQAIPGFVTRDRDRSLHLVYRSNSQRAPTALPFELLVSSQQLAPDSIQMTAQENGVQVGGTLRFFGTKVPNGAPANDPYLWDRTTERRIVGAELPSAATAQTAIRAIAAAITGLYGTLGPRTDTTPQEVVQVYLSDTTVTRFGQGWQLAELSRLSVEHVSQGAAAIVWIEGDGSYSVWRKPGTTWMGPVGETAQLVQASEAGSTYIVYLDNGASIGYDALGRQIWTADLAGNRTRFVYVGTTSRIDTIADPAGLAYRFQYNARGLVSEVWRRGTGGNTALGASLTYDAALPRLTEVKIWRSATQGDVTRFHYLASTSYGAYVDSVYDPRHTTGNPIVTAFDYDAVTLTPTGQHRPAPNASQPAGYAQIRDAWRRAVPRVGRGRSGQMAERLIWADQLRGTFIPFAGRLTDYQVDRFGGPTWVMAPARPPIMTPDFLIISFGADDERRIARDSAGRVTKIVRTTTRVLQSGTAVTRDSVMYMYHALNRIERVIRPTRRYPVPAAPQLDTTTFTWQYASLPAGGGCTVLTRIVDEMGAPTALNYGSSGAARCLPTTIVGPGLATTTFWYGSLGAGNAAGVRPVKTQDPNGLTDSMAYDPATWNSAVHVRLGDQATTRAFYGPNGWPDSTKDAAGTRTVTEYDGSGRVVRAKTGSGSNAPTVATFYNAGGLVDSTRVYASLDENLASVIGPVQTTINGYNRLGWMDSTRTPGGRSQRYQVWDNWGHPVWEFAGNGAFITRTYDSFGRLSWENQSAAGPSYSADGRPFAEPRADSVYRSLGLGFAATLSSGQLHRFGYSDQGGVARIVTWDVAANDSVLIRSYGYSPVGALIADTLKFANGPIIARAYEYNRRGQRTLAATTITGVTIAESRDSLRYMYDSLTARLDSMVGRVDSAGWRTYAGVRWLYDVGGRDTLQRTWVWSGGTSRPMHVRRVYNARGQLSQQVAFTTSCTGTGCRFGNWYVFAASLYNKLDHLYSASTQEPTGNGPSSGTYYALTSAYDSAGGTWRLRHYSNATPTMRTNTYDFDVFGNELSEDRLGPAGLCTNETSIYGADNAVVRVQEAGAEGCAKTSRYWYDKVGNRLVQLDTLTGGVYNGPQSIMSYTAKSQLFFSMTTTAQTGTYDYNWHWYDAAGRRMITHATTGQSWVPNSPPSTAGCCRTFYVYDGSDVALTIQRNAGGAWSVKARYLTGGVDDVLAGRFRSNVGTARNLALVADRGGSTLAAMGPDGQREVDATYYTRDPYGGLVGAVPPGTGGGTNTETGFSGASTPNASGGFVYLRNRWYDPQTGRFLTQDPIGLAGGVNLYSYAGNNPVAYTDPFGLCIPPLTPACLVAYGIALGVAWFGGTRVAYNAATDRPLAEGVQGDVASGSLVGANAGVFAGAGLIGAGTREAVREGAQALARPGSVQTGLLREFLGKGLQGAEQRAANFSLPQGLTRESLQWYAQQAQRAIASGIDKSGVQAARLKLVENALEAFDQ
jgi:RHS repeat-associated protein